MKSYIKFEYSIESSSWEDSFLPVTTTMTIAVDADIEQLVDQFEYFLLSIGYPPNSIKESFNERADWPKVENGTCPICGTEELETE